jgi:uroporphyrinogen decarboxylase
MSTDGSRFLRACRGRQTDAVPIWLMRQAGRYMPEYQALRARHSFHTLLTTPELACEITLQPVRAFGMDAAIVFSDILPILEVLGVPLRFDDAAGPQLEPLGAEGQLRTLSGDEIEGALGFTLEAIRLAARELQAQRVPLIGFSGAPFTLACYAIEGRIGHDCARTRTFMMARPERWQALQERLADAVGHYLRAQVAAGAGAVQLFDTWAGTLARADYERYALPYVRRCVSAARGLGVPVIYFSTQTGAMLDLVAQSGADVIGVDWRCDIGAARRRLGPERAIQGNLDPAALTAPWDVLAERATAVLEAAAGRGHIFNLGHGVPPTTPNDNVRRLVELVHSWQGAG